MKLVKDLDKTSINQSEVTDKEAEDAFKTILKWIGENPDREGLKETPKRVVKAFKEYFSGYHQDANKALSKTFGDVDGYDVGFNVGGIVASFISHPTYVLDMSFEYPTGHGSQKPAKDLNDKKIILYQRDTNEYKSKRKITKAKA